MPTRVGSKILYPPGRSQYCKVQRRLPSTCHRAEDNCQSRIVPALAVCVIVSSHCTTSRDPCGTARFTHGKATKYVNLIHSMILSSSILLLVIRRELSWVSISAWMEATQVTVSNETINQSNHQRHHTQVQPKHHRC